MFFFLYFLKPAVVNGVSVDFSDNSPPFLLHEVFINLDLT